MFPYGPTLSKPRRGRPKGTKNSNAGTRHTASSCAPSSPACDEVVLGLIHQAVTDLNESGPGGLLSKVALVANGGYGRHKVARLAT